MQIVSDRSAGRPAAPPGARRRLTAAPLPPGHGGTRRRRGRRGFRLGLGASLLLHALLGLLVVLAARQRQSLLAPTAQSGFEVVYQGAEPVPEVPSAPPEPAPPPPPDATAPAPAPPMPVPVPPAPPAPRLAEPPPPPQGLAAVTLPPPPPARPELQRAAPPPPLPPPQPLQPRPPQEAAVIAPQRPARPEPPTQRLPGLWLPEAAQLGAVARPAQPRRGLDLSFGALDVPGRLAPEPQVSVRGAQVGNAWRQAFYRWLEQNVRYPSNAALMGHEGSNRIRLLVDRDGRVRGARLLRGSGSVWLDAGLEMPFRNAVLPAFPPDADPEGVEVDLTVNWHLIRR